MKKSGQQRLGVVRDADIASCFDEIEHEALNARIERRVSQVEAGSGRYCRLPRGAGLGSSRTNNHCMEDAVSGGLVYHDDDWPHGLRCGQCRRELDESERYSEQLDGFLDEIPMLRIVCLDCALLQRG